jgi:hypothetical protein
MEMNIFQESSREIDLLPYGFQTFTIQFIEISPVAIDFPKNSHYTVDRVPAYASVFFNFPIVILKGTQLFRVPFTYFFGQGD